MTGRLRFVARATDVNATLAMLQPVVVQRAAERTMRLLPGRGIQEGNDYRARQAGVADDRLRYRPHVYNWPLEVQQFDQRVLEQFETLLGQPTLSQKESARLEYMGLNAIMATLHERRLNGMPEFAHWVGAALWAEKHRAQFGFGVEVTYAALLHDGPEDGWFTMRQVRRMMGGYEPDHGQQALAERAVDIVQRMTRAPGESNEHYLDRADGPYSDLSSAFVKMGDVIDRLGSFDDQWSDFLCTELTKAQANRRRVVGISPRLDFYLLEAMAGAMDKAGRLPAHIVWAQMPHNGQAPMRFD